MKNKILFVQTNYPGFLNSFHEKLGLSNSYSQMKKVWDKEWFGQGDFYSKRIKKYGFDGEEIILNSWPMQSKWALESGAIISHNKLRILEKLPESVKNFLGMRDWMKKVLFLQVESVKPDVVYMHDLSVLNEHELKKLKRSVKLVAGQIACPLPLNRRPLYHYDVIISSFPHYVDMFRSWGINSEYLPWCFDASIVKVANGGRKKHNVCFVGGYSAAHSQGNHLLEQIAKKVKVDFWGYGASSLSLNSPIRKTYHGEVWGKQMYQIMAQSRIVLNRHIDVAGNIANNMRMFDVTGVGSLLITDDKPNMEEFFKVGEEVVTYKSARDLISKINHYLNNPKIAQKIAHRGQLRTLKDHTYDIRMRDLASILKTYL